MSVDVRDPATHLAAKPAADDRRTEVVAVTAPPTRADRPAASRAASSRAALSNLAGRARWPRAAADSPPRHPRRRSPLLTPPAPRAKGVRGTGWWFGAAILVASALLLTFVAHAAVFSGFQHSRAQTLAYEELRQGLAKATTPVNQVATALDGDLAQAEMNPLGVPVALLAAPSIGLSEVVLEGTTADVLRSGAGHRRDSVLPGQSGVSVILGRQLAYGGPFAQLYRLQPGDEITVTTGEGTNTYRVLGLRRAGDPQPEALTAGGARLELQTADGLALFPSGVLHVDAELVSDAHPAPFRAMSYPALPVDERAMGQSPRAWFAAFSVFVLFAAAGVGMWWLWRSWGRWHAWVVGMPVVVALGVITADLAMNALPNLL